MSLSVLDSIKCEEQMLISQELQIPPSFNMYLVINKCTTLLFFYSYYLVNIAVTDQLRTVMLVTSITYGTFSVRVADSFWYTVHIYVRTHTICIAISISV